ncbi:hypothetical protein ACP70R_002639 [Stipagrostis hirtigluma subsp. patula]
MAASRGSIASFATYRPPLQVDMFSVQVQPSLGKEQPLIDDGDHYNYNGRPIPAAALKAIVARRPELATAEDVDSGRATGLVFVSERDSGLETLHVALRLDGKVTVLSLADVYGAGVFGGVRMEDSGCFGGGFAPGADLSIVYVSTKKPVEKRRAPWTVVYRTSLLTGETEQLTPDGQYDLSPAVSPSGTRVAVANFRGNRWAGEIEHLHTDIVVMNVDRRAQGGRLDRRRLIRDGGWPSWGSDDVVFFHRGLEDIDPKGKVTTTWGVFRHDLRTGETVRVTPADINAMTPAAIGENKVAVATIRLRTNQMSEQREEAEYRHIEIFDVADPGRPAVTRITQNVFAKADYYNPFVLDGGRSIGYHRTRREKVVLKNANGQSDVPRTFNMMRCPHEDVGQFRVSGVFPSFSTDGSKLAFVDNEFKAVWLADKQGLRVVWERRSPNSVFSTVWNQNAELDILYVCVGEPFSTTTVEIYAIFNVSGEDRQYRKLTAGNFNNAFPSSNPEGTKIVFRSTRDHATEDFKYKNLYVLEDAHAGELAGGVTRLTDGRWTDTHCQWSPRGDWIVFSSTRDKPASAPTLDNGIDLGYFAVFLLLAADPEVVVRVVTSAPPMPGPGGVAGHVNHPIFSPDCRSMVITSDLAAVSAEPISMPTFLHSVRPYGDIFSVDIDPDDIRKNRDIQKFTRITHSRYEYSTPAWTKFSTDDPDAKWNMLVRSDKVTRSFRPACPYAHDDGGESWHLTGHMILPRKCC